MRAAGGCGLFAAAVDLAVFALGRLRFGGLGGFAPVGHRADETVFAEADQILAPGLVQRLNDEAALIRAAPLQQRALHILFVRRLGDVDRLHRAWVDAGVVHAGADRAGRGVEILHLLGLAAAAVEILRTGLYQLLYMDSVPESAAVNESVKLCKKMKCFSAQGFVNGMLRSFIRSGKKISYLGLEPEKRLSVEYSCPEWLTEKLIREYGTDFAVKALKASVGRPPVYARVNTLKTTTEKLLAELSKHRIKAEAYPGLENCIRLEKPGDIEKCAPFGRDCSMFRISRRSSAA